MTDLIRTEWLKVRTSRSTWIILVLGLAAVAGVAIANGVEFGEGPEGTHLAERIETAAGGAGELAPFILILGTLAFTTEFRYGTISSTLLNAPVRTEVMASKLLTLGVFALITGAIIVGATAGVTLGILESRDYSVPIERYDLFRPLVGGVLYLGICAVVGVAIGALVRQAAIAVAVVLAWPLVVESTLGAFLPDYVAKYLPFDAGARLFATSPAGPDTLEFWLGGAVFATWAAVLVVAAFIVFDRHDVSTSG